MGKQPKISAGKKKIRRAMAEACSQAHVRVVRSAITALSRSRYEDILAKACVEGNISKVKKILKRFRHGEVDFAVHNCSYPGEPTPLKLATLLAACRCWLDVLLVFRDGEVDLAARGQCCPNLVATSHCWKLWPWRQWVEIIKLLLQHGANPFVVHDACESAFEIALNEHPNSVQSARLIALFKKRCSDKVVDYWLEKADAAR